MKKPCDLNKYITLFVSDVPYAPLFNIPGSVRNTRPN